MLKALKLFYIICLIPKFFHIFSTEFCGKINVGAAQSSAILLQSYRSKQGHQAGNVVQSDWSVTK